jgi:hypothetical protein
MTFEVRALIATGFIVALALVTFLLARRSGALKSFLGGGLGQGTNSLDIKVSRQRIDISTSILTIEYFSTKFVVLQSNGQMLLLDKTSSVLNSPTGKTEAMEKAL